MIRSLLLAGAREPYATVVTSVSAMPSGCLVAALALLRHLGLRRDDFAKCAGLSTVLERIRAGAYADHKARVTKTARRLCRHYSNL